MTEVSTTDAASMVWGALGSTPCHMYIERNARVLRVITTTRLFDRMYVSNKSVSFPYIHVGKYIHSIAVLDNIHIELKFC